MRVSRLMLVTLRDDPAEAEIASHKLLLRAGYIRRIGNGIYAYLPLLWRVLQKVSAVVREELNAAGSYHLLVRGLAQRSRPGTALRRTRLKKRHKRSWNQEEISVAERKAC